MQFLIRFLIFVIISEKEEIDEEKPLKLRAAKKRKPKKTDKINKAPKISKTISVVIQRLSEKELIKYSVPIINYRPGPLSKKGKLAVTQNSNKTEDPKPKTKAIQRRNWEIEEEVDNFEVYYTLILKCHSNEKK